MKRVLYLVSLLVAIFFSACSSDEPNNDSGKLVVELTVTEDDQIVDLPTDFSDYTIVIVPQSGWIYSADVKDIVWPVDISVGSYTVAAVSPTLEENDNTTTCYYGEVNNVRILKDETTSIVINMSRREFPKSDLE